jgi:hypothetical protein
MMRDQGVVLKEQVFAQWYLVQESDFGRIVCSNIENDSRANLPPTVDARAR